MNAGNFIKSLAKKVELRIPRTEFLIQESAEKERYSLELSLVGKKTWPAATVNMRVFGSRPYIECRYHPQHIHLNVYLWRTSQLSPPFMMGVEKIINEKYPLSSVVGVVESEDELLDFGRPKIINDLIGAYEAWIAVYDMYNAPGGAKDQMEKFVKKEMEIFKRIMK